MKYLLIFALITFGCASGNLVPKGCINCENFLCASERADFEIKKIKFFKGKKIKRTVDTENKASISFYYSLDSIPPNTFTTTAVVSVDKLTCKTKTTLFK